MNVGAVYSCACVYGGYVYVRASRTRDRGARCGGAIWEYGGTHGRFEATKLIGEL